jgi:hypothetical protein
MLQAYLWGQARMTRPIVCWRSIARPAVCTGLNLLEVSPRSEHVPFLVDAATTWLLAFPDSKDVWVAREFAWRFWRRLEISNATARCSPNLREPMTRKDWWLGILSF